MATTWIDIEIRAVTDRAILVKDLKDNNQWIPKSQIEDYTDDMTNGAEISIELPNWLAAEKDLI